MVAGGTVGKRHASHTKKARTIAGDTVAKGAKRVVTRTAPGVKSIAIKSGGSTYTRTRTKVAGSKATRTAFTKTPATPPATPPPSGNVPFDEGNWTPGMYANLKSRKKRKAARTAHKARDAARTPTVSTIPGSGGNY